MWCVPELNDEYIEKMEDLLGTYEQPYDPREPVVCLDEKPITLQAEVGSVANFAAGKLVGWKRCRSPRTILSRDGSTQES
jgi:hypothetical protein